MLGSGKFMGQNIFVSNINSGSKFVSIKKSKYHNLG